MEYRSWLRHIFAALCDCCLIYPSASHCDVDDCYGSVTHSKNVYVRAEMMGRRYWQHDVRKYAAGWSELSFLVETDQLERMALSTNTIRKFG
jgi:hypothetical protein